MKRSTLFLLSFTLILHLMIVQFIREPQYLLTLTNIVQNPKQTIEHLTSFKQNTKESTTLVNTLLEPKPPFPLIIKLVSHPTINSKDIDIYLLDSSIQKTIDKRKFTENTLMFIEQLRDPAFDHPYQGDLLMFKFQHEGKIIQQPIHIPIVEEIIQVKLGNETVNHPFKAQANYLEINYQDQQFVITKAIYHKYQFRSDLPLLPAE